MNWQLAMLIGLVIGLLFGILAEAIHFSGRIKSLRKEFQTSLQEMRTNFVADIVKSSAVFLVEHQNYTSDAWHERWQPDVDIFRKAAVQGEDKIIVSNADIRRNMEIIIDDKQVTVLYFDPHDNSHAQKTLTEMSALSKLVKDVVAGWVPLRIVNKEPIYI